MFGVTMFLGLLLFAVQLALNLYATSALTSVAFDAARKVAGADATSPASAEQDARSLLHGLEEDGGHLEFDWAASTPDEVVLEVTAVRRPPLLPSAARYFPFQTIHRTVTVRRERPR